MRRLRTQSAMLSEEPVSQDSTQSARSRSRYYSFFRRHRGLRAITPGAQKDRDEVRTFEAHPEARSTSTARPARRPGRVCSGRHRSESATARIAGRSATTRSGSVHRVTVELRKERQGRRVKAAALNERPTGPIRCNRLLQQNLPIGDIVRNMVRWRFERRVEQTASDGGRARGAQTLGDSLPAVLRIELGQLGES